MSSIGIEISERSARLRQQILEDREKVRRFSEQLDENLKMTQKKHKDIQLKGEETLKELERQDRQFRLEAENLKQELERESQTLRSLEKEKEQLSKKKQTYPEKMKSLQESLDKNSELMLKNQQRFSEKEKSRKKTEMQLSKGISYYEDRLGLKVFSLEKGVLRFSFKYINPQQPEKEYNLDLAILEDKSYKIIKTEPKLSEEVLQQPLRQANMRAIDFKTFIRRIRKEFVALNI
jgi:DNA repair exonuclease SbcCD ATPase subunit